MRNYSDLAVPGPGTVMKYPDMYVGKPGAIGTATRGRNLNYYTARNEGVEATGNNTPQAARACEYIDPGSGINEYTDYSSCFIYPTDQWFSIMTHVVLGPPGTARQFGNNNLPFITGYTGSTIEYYGAYAGQPWSLLHRRTNAVMPYDVGSPGGEGFGRYGMFGWTTFMTAKWRFEVHPSYVVWVSQIIVQPGPTMPAPPL